jgi:MFS family permease
MDKEIQKRTVVACVLGVCFEGFDFIVYSMLSFMIARLYFPTGNEVTSLLFSLGTFGLAYIVRPVSGIFWGIFSDKIGRRNSLIWISWLMAIATGIIAVAPTYAAIGLWAPALLVFARLLQGFSAGGEFASATAMLIEYAPPNKRGLYASWQMAAQVATIGAAAALVLVLMGTLSHADMQRWGWRMPFAIGILIGPIGYYMRSRLVDSPEFTQYIRQKGSPEKTPMRVVLRHYRRESLSTAGLILIGTASFYLTLVYLPLYAARELHISMQDAQVSTIICCVVQFFVCLGAGASSDRHGRRAILLPAAIVYVLICYPLFAQLIAHPSFTTLLVAQMPINILIGMISGPMPATLAELFPTQVRASGLGLIYNLVGAIFGGLSPFIITWLIATTGDRASPAYWAMGTGVVGIVAIASLRKRPQESARAQADGEPAAARR